MATRNVGEEILTLYNELLEAEESGGEDAVPRQPGELLLSDELPPEPPIRKIDVRPRPSSVASKFADSAQDAPPVRREDSAPRLAWSAGNLPRRASIVNTSEPVDRSLLAATLADARRLAASYDLVQARTRSALYNTLGRAYDLALLARLYPLEYRQLLREAEIEVADRAPLVALAKLVFGKDYDRTRLSEFASVIAHCLREGLAAGSAATYIAELGGGIRQIVGQERLARQGAMVSVERTRPRKSIARKLARSPAHGMELLDGEGDEYVLVIARRNVGGGAVLLGEVPRDVALLEKAAKRFLGEGRA